MLLRVNKYLDDLENRHRHMDLLDMIERRFQSLEMAQKVPERILKPTEKASDRPFGLNDPDRRRSL